MVLKEEEEEEEEVVTWPRRSHFQRPFTSVKRMDHIDQPVSKGKATASSMARIEDDSGTEVRFRQTLQSPSSECKPYCLPCNVCISCPHSLPISLITLWPTWIHRLRWNSLSNFNGPLPSSQRHPDGRFEESIRQRST